MREIYQQDKIKDKRLGSSKEAFTAKASLGMDESVNQLLNCQHSQRLRIINCEVAIMLLSLG